MSSSNTPVGSQLSITCRKEEDLLIETALQVLDRRLFVRGPKLEKPREVCEYLKLQLAEMEHEVFAVIYLDTVHRLIKYEVLFHGTVNAAIVYPRQVVKRALAHNASAIIIAHNHPSGCTDPSLDDRRLTKRLKESLELVDIRVLDHFIVGEGLPVSFAELGWL
ncbi:RadC family protein [Pseudomonas marginalis]|uniref:RadC family protein n=1 Tax=Pseudomonas marginalis TaxID=298 RepID=UPI00247FC1F3|nr:DNA repair protein RadC [Pseudomonas marginalis]WGT27050.1 DNA repair protein RadC [Pseudomonas marginalis]